jgi:hypothetical protein
MERQLFGTIIYALVIRDYPISLIAMASALCISSFDKLDNTRILFRDKLN